MCIGKNIKNARKNKGFTQKQLGEKLGVSASMIAQYETGTRKPKSDTLKKIATALGVNSSSLYAVPNSFKMELVEKFDSELEIEFKEKIFHNYRKLNPIGRDKLAEYAEDLTKIPEYKKDFQEKPE